MSIKEKVINYTQLLNVQIEILNLSNLNKFFKRGKAIESY